MITTRITPLTSGAIAAAFSGNWQLLGGTFSEPAFLLRIVNASSVVLQISYDGTNIDDYVQSGTTLQIEAPTNPQHNASPANFPAGTQVYIKGAVVSTGNVYLAAYTYYSGK